jgi:hypothetical protein
MIATPNPTRNRTVRRLVAGITIAGAMAVPLAVTPAVSVTASAASPASQVTAATDQEQLGSRVRVLCDRAAAMLRRANAMLDRILGDADVVGSLAFIDARIARAEEAGREDLVVVLQNRREIRASLIPILERHIARLEQLLARCEELKAGR